MNLRDVLLTSTAIFAVAFGCAITQINTLTEELNDRPPAATHVVTETVTEIETVKVPVEVIKEVVVTQTVTEVQTVEVPVYIEVPTTEIQTVEVPSPSTEIYLNELPACLTDEVTSVNCYWDAQTQGNGLGTSFISYNGTAYYPEG